MRKPDGKRKLGIPRRRWEDNIKIVLEEIEQKAWKLNDLAWDMDGWRAFVNAAINLQGFIKQLLASQEGHSAPPSYFNEFNYSTRFSVVYCGTHLTC